MADIVLTAGVRQNLLQLQKTADLITATQTKLATGKRVNTALDNPINFFTAQGLSNRASDLGNLLNSMSNGVNTIQAANNGITSITKLVQSAQALISQAQQTADTTVRAGLAVQFDAIRSQIDTLSPAIGLQRHQPARWQQPDSHPQRNRHLVGHHHRRHLQLRRSRDRRLDQQLGCRRGHHRGIGHADRRVDYAALAGPGVLDQPVDRADPPGIHQGDDQHAADRRGSLTLADSNEEDANLLALQTRQQLSTTALLFAGRAERTPSVPITVGP